MKDIYVLLHDIRSVHNVGSIFRTSDALGIKKIYLTGHTPTPLDRFGNKRSDVAKVALGAESTIPWEYEPLPLPIIEKLKEEKVSIISVEQHPNAIDYKKVELSGPALFIFGNEVEGVSEDLLTASDVIAEIPMNGKKESLNVSVAFGVALFRMLDK